MTGSRGAGPQGLSRLTHTTTHTTMATAQTHAAVTAALCTLTTMAYPTNTAAARNPTALVKMSGSTCLSRSPPASVEHRDQLRAAMLDDARTTRGQRARILRRPSAASRCYAVTSHHAVYARNQAGSGGKAAFRDPPSRSSATRAAHQGSYSQPAISKPFRSRTTFLVRACSFTSLASAF
jgi:hypothetical protein